MSMFKRFLCVLLTLAALWVVPASSADNGAKVFVSKVQRLTAGTRFDSDAAPEIKSAKAGDVVVLTVAFRNDAAEVVDVNGFLVTLRYDAAEVAPYQGSAPFTTRSYQISPELVADYGWAQAGNDKDGFTAVSSGGRDIVSVAPGATLVLARMAFTVKADVDFAFDLADTYLNVANAKQKKLTPDAQSFRLTLSDAYAIIAVTENGVTLANPGPATLAVSYFGADGRFLSAELKAVPADAGTVPATFKDAAKVRVMLMDGDCRPLCVYE